MQRLKAIPQLAVIPVIVVSARDRAANENRALMAGASAYFQKPFDDAALLAAIRDALGEEEPPVSNTGALKRRATDV